MYLWIDQKAIEIVKHKHEPESVTYLNRAASKKIKVEAPEALGSKTQGHQGPRITNGRIFGRI